MRLFRKRMKAFTVDLHIDEPDVGADLTLTTPVNPFLERLIQVVRETPYGDREAKRSMVGAIAGLDPWCNDTRFRTDFWRDKHCPALDDFFVANWPLLKMFVLTVRRIRTESMKFENNVWNLLCEVMMAQDYNSSFIVTYLI